MLIAQLFANQLIRENNLDSNKTWVWIYDDAGNILSKKEYAYTTGTLGPVLDTIYYTYGNSNWGDLLTSYDGKSITYDAWGKPLTTVDNTSFDLGDLNPLRYRGYVYDEETELYYLQSRYYNPEWDRFLNADNYPSTGQGLTGNNMFTYCGNNPVSRSDDGGEFWHLVIGGVIGGIIGAVSSAVSGGDVADVIIGTIAGALGGVLAASGAGVVVQALGSAAISMASNAASQINGMISDPTGETTFNVGDMLFDGAVGLICGIAGGNGASYGNVGGSNAATKQWFKKGFFNSSARKLYVKNACRAGGDHVFDALLSSMDKNVIGAAITTGKNLLTNWGII